MSRPSIGRIERHLLALDHEGFCEFVADLWEACGWEVSRDGHVLELSRQRASKRLLVLPPRRFFPRFRRAPETTGPIDAVVSPLTGTDRSTIPRGTPAVPVIDAEEIHERLVYALDEETRERLLLTHLGIEDCDRPDEGRSVVPALRISRIDTSSVASAGLLFVLAGLAILLVTAGIPIGDSASGTADASESDGVGGVATASADVYDAYPNCQRGPGEVAEISADATRGSSFGRGLAVMGNFWNPRHVSSLPNHAWRDMVTTEAHMAFYDAESVTIREPEVDGDDATVIANATIDGETRQYRFELGRGERTMGDGCWMIEAFGPV